MTAVDRNKGFVTQITRMKFRHLQDNKTLSLFDYQPKAQVSKVSVESKSRNDLSDFERSLRAIIKEALKGYDREDVACKMSDLLGREVTKTNLNEWTAFSKPERRIHFDAAFALCQILNNYKILHFFTEALGFKALHEDQAVFAELGLKTAMKQKADKELKQVNAELNQNPQATSFLEQIRGDNA